MNYNHLLFKLKLPDIFDMIEFLNIEDKFSIVKEKKMKIEKKKVLDLKGNDCVILPVFKNINLGEVFKLYPEIEFFAKQYKFKGKIGDQIVFNSSDLAKLFIVVGAGDFKQNGNAKKCSKNIIGLTKDNRIKKGVIQFVQDADIPLNYLINFIDFLYLNFYKFDAYLSQEKKEKPLQNLSLVFNDKTSLNTHIVAERESINSSVKLVRDMVNEIPAKINPDTMVKSFSKTARASKLGIRVYRRKELLAEKMNGILSVGQGSPYEPALVKLSYVPEKCTRTIALVGKGITFDSGGLNIKVGNYMEEMKCDMAGAATVLGIIKAASDLKLPIRILAYAAIAENMPGKSAYKPGDIITYNNKKSVEVVNTDAEGRLVLADALICAARDKPDYIVEFSTLTGAIVVALGDTFGGLMSRNRKLVSLLLKSGTKTGELLWEMPLYEDYRESIKSKIADLKNANYQGASSIKAGLFLDEFASQVPFAHIDIAGTAFLSKSNQYYLETGATGFGVRLILDFLSSV